MKNITNHRTLTTASLSIGADKNYKVHQLGQGHPSTKLSPVVLVQVLSTTSTGISKVLDVKAKNVSLSHGSSSLVYFPLGLLSPKVSYRGTNSKESVSSRETISWFVGLSARVNKIKSQQSPTYQH